MSQLSLIAAMADNRVIGRDNRLPWHVRSDLINFKNLTLGKPVIMGRKTFDSLRAPLVDRPNIVITRDPNFHSPNIEVFRSVEEGIDFARRLPAEEIMVIGGEQIFDATLNSANRMYLTLIRTIIDDGDAFFPEYDASQWREVDKRSLETSNEEPEAEFVTLERRELAA